VIVIDVTVLWKEKKVKVKFALLVILALIYIVAFASGAPWYKWINLQDRMILCTQNPPGEAWVKYQGPYSESSCRKLGNPE
jgi:hypothetical protein